MHKEFIHQVNQSKMIHIPLPVDRSEYAEQDIYSRTAVKSLIVDDFTGLDGWAVDAPAHMELSDEYSEDNQKSIKFTCQTRLKTWPASYARIYATPYLTKEIPKEDYREYNRIAVSIRPEMQGFKQVSIHIQLVNTGDNPVPDRYFREGCHHLNLKNHEWNHVNVEIPNVHRDQVVGIQFGYDMVGNEREATDTACFYIKNLRMETVEKTEKYKGWEPEKGKLLFCGTGYQPNSLKMAITNSECEEYFSLVNAHTGKVVLKEKVKKQTTSQGDFAILDFTSVEEEGSYLIVCGDMISRTFPIKTDVLEDSIWKSINLFFCERCGYEVPGIHKYCHGNIVCHHGEKSAIANGGWHDAADMSQNLTNTSDAVYAMFRAAKEQSDNKPLFERLVEEGKWGLDWMLRTRFDNGYRNTGSGTSVWTGNILGECDQVDSKAQKLAIENFMAAAAEALACGVLKEIDREQSDYLKKVAVEDWNYAYEDIDSEQYVETMDPARVSSPVLLYSMGVISACELYEITKESYYYEKAVEITERIIACQRIEYPSWDIPLTGFFYRDAQKTQVQHYNHRCYEHSPIMALKLMCEMFPEHDKWIEWYQSVLLYTEYYKQGVKSTAPYNMAPASIYHISEAEKDAELFLNQQAFSHPGMLDEYKAQVKNGVALGDGYYLRRFPIWFSYRGNNGLILASGNAAAFGADVTNDFYLQQLAAQQLEWVVGRNPFGQSLMIGEGYNYAEQYLCLPGEINGGICVGIQSYQDEDAPYWPQCNNAVYRELWIHPSIRYLLLSSHLNRNSVLYGYLKGSNEKALEITSISKNSKFFAEINPITGGFDIELPSGVYNIRWNGMSKIITLIAGQHYEITDNFINLEADYHAVGKQITIKLDSYGRGISKLELKSVNVELIETDTIKLGESKEYKATILDEKKPWLVTIIPDGNRKEKVDIYPIEKAGEVNG